jgi:hypothetical protein
MQRHDQQQQLMTPQNFQICRDSSLSQKQHAKLLDSAAHPDKDVNNSICAKNNLPK